MARLRRRQVPVVMLFAEADDGLEFLQTRCDRALRREQRVGSLQVVEIPGIDHQMHREWRRVAVVECMQTFLAQFPPGADGDVSGDTRRTLEMA